MPLIKRLLLVALVLLALPYLIGPIHARFQIEEPASLDLEELGPEERDSLDWRVRAYFDETIASAVSEEGFEPAVIFRVPTAPSSRRIYGAVYRAEHRPGLLTAIAHLDPDRRVLAGRKLNLTTVLDDGTTVETDDESWPMPDPSGLRHRYLPVPGLRDPLELVRLHCAFTAVAVEASRIRWIPPGAELAELARELEVQRHGRVEAGLWTEDTVEGSAGEEIVVQRPTWKGAFDLTWGQAWPVGSLRRHGILKEAAQVRSELPQGDALASACTPMERPPPAG